MPKRNQKVLRATVVELDLIRYSDRMRRLHDEFGPEGVTLFDEQIESFVKKSLRFLKRPKKMLKSINGDGFVLVFPNADDAHHFAVAVHELCNEENKKKRNSEALRWFRIGAATGEVNAAYTRVHGAAITEAVRLEAAGEKGHILVDEATYQALSKICRAKYGSLETLKDDKHGRAYRAHRCKAITVSDWSSGVMRAEHLRSSRQRLPNEVFAIELLTQPVHLKRAPNGHLSVTIDRKRVKEMLISNDGKMAKCRQFISTPSKKAAVEKLDGEIQGFLAGNKPGLHGDRAGERKLDLDLEKEGIGLRWASGGILSVVHYRNREWVPLFFRDIRPYGWNISLGSTERCFEKDGGLKEPPPSLEGELKAPWRYIFREFLEESLVFTGTPSEEATLSRRRFKFQVEDSVAKAVAEEFDREHREHRKEKDKIDIIDTEAENDIKVDFEGTNCTLYVKSETDSEPIPTHDVLVCFSLLDLGIEVVKIARYRLKKDDYMLDGEIRVKDNPETGQPEKELVRMPIALISCDYLKRTFRDPKKWQSYKYTLGPQPSIEVPKGPRYDRSLEKTEIVIFDWDVKRHMQIVNGESGTMWEKTRYLNWYDQWHRNFFDTKGRFSEANPSRLFVPGTAKILNLYFTAKPPDKQRGKGTR